MVDGEGEGDRTPSAPIGVAYDPSSQLPISEWSAAVYDELHDWAQVQNGRWEFWGQDYLVLTITSQGSEAIEPVVIDTCEGELTISFGYWEAHLPGDGIYDDTDSERAAIEAMNLTNRWLAGEIGTAIYFRADDSWCGSKLIEDFDDRERLTDIAWIEDFKPVRVEIRKARKADWQHIRFSNA